MYCTKCGWNNSDEAKKCANCSAELQGPPPAAPQQPTQYPQQNNYQPTYQPAPQAQNPSNTLSIIGLVLGALSILLCPLLFGGAGITLGAIGISKKEKLGLVALIVSICCMIIGIVRGVIMGLAQMKSMGYHF